MGSRTRGRSDCVVSEVFLSGCWFYFCFVVFFQNIIKKVSGQKFVYKFVSQPDPSLPEGVRNGEESQRRDSTDPNSQLKGLGGVPSSCPSKGLPQVPFDFIFVFVLQNLDTQIN